MKRNSAARAAGLWGRIMTTAVVAAACAPSDQPSGGAPPEGRKKAWGENAQASALALDRAAGCDPACVDVGRFVVREETVSDRQDGQLVWQRRVTRRLPQAEAARYCGALSLEGLSGFRLPSTHELSAIRYRPGGLFGGGRKATYCIPCIDQEAFPDTPADSFWTSGIEPDGTGWYVGFDDGRSHRDVQSDALWVRCVHGPVDDRGQ
jgi:hypothetical protein